MRHGDHHRYTIAAATLGAAALFLAALPLPGARAQTAALGGTDREFVEKAAQGGHAEVAMGKMAAESKNDAVRDFGRQMIDEHTRMNDELAGIASRKGLTPPASPDLGSQAKGAVMNVLPGKTFDSQYVSSQLDDHQETLELFQKQTREGGDPDLKAFAEKGVPVIQKHIDELRELQKRPELR